MKHSLFVILCSICIVHARPQEADSHSEDLISSTTEIPSTNIPIIKDDRIDPLHGNFAFDFETGDGIQRTESGSRSGVRKGVIRYPLPNGEIFELKFTAGPNGFQPESDYLPQAPVFPHPIPPHAQAQIDRHRG